jgi:hypothetical protein
VDPSQKGKVKTSVFKVDATQGDETNTAAGRRSPGKGDVRSQMTVSFAASPYKSKKE